VRSDSSRYGNSGLSYWMMEVTRILTKAGENLDNETIHDLRVALRRCRSMADGFRALDPGKNWKKMRRQATGLFDSLGCLRDCHVMMEWVEKLGPEDDPVTARLLQHFRQLMPQLGQQAALAIENFDRQEWQTWTGTLPRRTARLHPGAEVFQAMALEKLNVARRIQAGALRSCGEATLHQLRIGLKKFRYVVENFLPQHHENWKDGLKHVQELLGEIHDLYLLQHAVVQVAADTPPEAKLRWEQMLDAERSMRIQRYRESTSGKDSLWLAWRSGLPRGRAARQASLKKLQAWSSFLDSDLKHSRRVARFAIQILDGLSRVGVLHSDSGHDRELLRAAAIAHEIGRASGDKNHHKKSGKMIGQLDYLAGWNRRDVVTMARVTRYHRGSFPRVAKLRDVPSAQRHRIKLLAGILRLANALDDQRDGSVRGIILARKEGFVVIYAAGLPADSAVAEHIAGARHLLEQSCGLPILVRPAPRRPATLRNRVSRSA
jgi:CHAD domain-containing protein